MHSSLNHAAMFPSLSVTYTIIVTRVLTKTGKQLQRIYFPINTFIDQYLIK